AMVQPARDLEAELRERAAARERLVAERRARLQGYPQPVRAQFERLLTAAQQATVLASEHNYWIDCRGTYQVRRVLLEWGCRLAQARVIEQRDDVFYLTLGELGETARTFPGAN